LPGNPPSGYGGVIEKRKRRTGIVEGGIVRAGRIRSWRILPQSHRGEAYYSGQEQQPT
jgi:hypothetical protein